LRIIIFTVKGDIMKTMEYISYYVVEKIDDPLRIPLYTCRDEESANIYMNKMRNKDTRLEFRFLRIYMIDDPIALN